MTRPLVRKVTVETTQHATEDPGKVLEALLSVLPEELRDKVKPVTQILKGHYGNPITRVRVELKGEEAEKAARYIFSALSEGDHRVLRLTLEQRLDKTGNLYLRLDKQKALRGKLTLYDGDDVIRVVIGLRGRKRLEVLENLGFRAGSS